MKSQGYWGGHIRRSSSTLAYRALACITGLFAAFAIAGNPSNPILFVTQVPIPEEVNSRDMTQSFMSVASPFSNHLADTTHAGRGGSLYIRFANGQLFDLLNLADWGAIPGGKPASDAMAVRNPAVHFSASKALFAMTYGKPSGPADTTTYLFQLYEITLPTQAQLNSNVQPVLTKVANQPPYNNVSPTYAPGNRIVFASDRPYNGQAHLGQREEYLSLPTVSGLWSLDPADAASLRLLHHAPSGAFGPIVDSAGRVIFSNWDHLARDTQAVTDSRPPDTTLGETFTQTVNGSGNFASEAAGAAFSQVTAMTPNTWDIFPEPRNFDRKTLQTFYPNLNGNAFNLFMPWMINLDGTGGELVNHVGRHEVFGPGANFKRSFTNDANLLDFDPATAPSSSNGNYAIHNFFANFHAPREDPLNPGTFFGADAMDLGTHGAGRIIRLTGGAPGANPDSMLVQYLTQNVGAPTVKGGMNIPPLMCGNVPCINPLASPVDLYRTPLPLADGNLVASHVAVQQTDYNTGTVANPATVAGYSFRLRSLKPPVAPALYYSNDVTLTTGITLNVSYWAGATLVSYNGLAWELDPVEVVPRQVPPVSSEGPVHAVTAAQFASAGVDLPTFRNYLAANNAALSVSFDITKRDRHDRQQPFNLRVAWSGHQTLATGVASGIYDVAWARFFEADLRRGYLVGGPAPQPGRRVVATPLYSTAAANVATAGAPAGAVRIGDDGSVAAIVPARKAMTWDLLGNDAANTSLVKERFWVTFQPGEIRTCTNCHGINTADQAGAPAPSNPPAALTALLNHWKTTHPPGLLQFAATVSHALKNAGTAIVNVARTAGSTGPASVIYSTQDGSALASIDYAPATGTLTWSDGDTSPKPISITLLNNPVITASKSLQVNLSSPTFATLGSQSTMSLTIDEPIPPATTLDIDGNGSYSATSDGVLLLRYLQGLRGNAMGLSIVSTNANRRLASDIALYLDSIAASLDVDGDGQVNAATDGVIIIRYLLGLRGSALIGGLSGVGPRPVSQIETLIQALTP